MNQILKKMTVAVLCAAMSLSFCACGAEEPAVEEPEGMVFTLEGKYYDSVSGQAMLIIEKNEEDELVASVMWGTSSEEYFEWLMTVTPNEDETRLDYTDCARYHIVHDTSTGHMEVETMFENGSGYFSVEDWTVLWDGAGEESCRDCVFEK